MKEWTYDELKECHGKSASIVIKDEIENHITDAKIAVEDGNIFICQNVVDGYECYDTLGYKYSYQLTDKERKMDEEWWSDLRIFDNAIEQPTSELKGTIIDGWEYFSIFNAKGAEKYIGRKVRYGDTDSVFQDETDVLISIDDDYSPFEVGEATWKYIGVKVIDPKNVVTKEQIAQKFGIPVDELIIEGN